MTTQHQAADSAPRPTHVFDGLLLFVGVALLLFWSLQWSDAAPDGRLVSWAFVRPALIGAALVLHGVLLVLLLVRAGSGERVRSLLPRIGLAGLGVLATVAFLGAANTTLRLAGDDLLSAKLRQYERIADQVDTVFIGSSRIYRHLDPVVYDRVRSERGDPGLSFNLGVPDMRMLEVLYLAEWVFERSEKIELLVIEATADPLELPEWNRKAERTVAWHDEKAMARIRRGIAQLDASEEERASLLAAHLEPFERRMSAVGRGLRLLDSEEWPGLPAAQRGYQSLEQNQRHPISEDEAAELVERWNRLHERPGDWRRSLARLERQGTGGHTTDAFEQELFAELEALAARKGARVLWLVSPGPTRRPNLIAAAEKRLVQDVLRFDDPARYPEFYAAAGRFDRHHLNDGMAARMTTLVAEAVLAEDKTAP
jgi:hypothetical protein